MTQFVKKFFALTHPDRPYDVDILAVVTHRDITNDELVFDVLNGAWRGRFNQVVGEIFILDTRAYQKVLMVWTDDKLPYIDTDAAIEAIKGKLK